MTGSVGACLNNACAGQKPCFAEGTVCRRAFEAMRVFIQYTPELPPRMGKVSVTSGRISGIRREE